MAKNEGNNQKVEETEVKQEEVQQAQEVQAAPTPVQQQAAPVEEKGGFKGWFKKHWKGVTAAVVGAAAAGGSAYAAYRKGKAAGINAGVPVNQEPEDYSLNPNE
jgi:hypothetical protein